MHVAQIVAYGYHGGVHEGDASAQKRHIFNLFIKFLTKFIRSTENFCNFVVGNHEYILLFNFISDWNSAIKVQKISQITNFLCNFLIPN